MKIGIVVPFSWSFWGAVVEHAELQAAALEELGHDVRLVMGNDPPGQFTRVLHPRVGRHGNPPPNVIPVGRSVIVPANGSLDLPAQGVSAPQIRLQDLSTNQDVCKNKSFQLSYTGTSHN